MKVTIKFDESAGLLPSEVKAKQAAEEYARERNKQWRQSSECEKGCVFTAATLAEALERAGVR